MIESNIFVGRREEIQRFVEILREKKGQAILVVGQAPMGKTCLINKMTEVAERHSELKCVAVHYEVIPTDSVDSILAIMLDHAFDASRAASKYFSGKISPLECLYRMVPARKSCRPPIGPGSCLLSTIPRRRGLAKTYLAGLATVGPAFYLPLSHLLPHWKKSQFKARRIANLVLRGV